jgi:hypothetical protein
MIQLNLTIFGGVLKFELRASPLLYHFNHTSSPPPLFALIIFQVGSDMLAWSQPQTAILVLVPSTSLASQAATIKSGLLIEMGSC